MRIEPRPAVIAFAFAALIGAVPALAQMSPQPTTADDSATSSKPVDPDAPSSNSVDATGTFSVNPPIAADPGLGGMKAGPSRTDMNGESDATATEASSSTRPDPKADVNNSDPGPQLPASLQ